MQILDRSRNRRLTSKQHAQPKSRSFSHSLLERGAATVELAIVLPLVVMLLFGTVEPSWAFAVANDVHHGAREGARLAAVDHGNVATIAAEVCDRMDIINGTVTISLADASGGVDDGALGSEGRITISVTYASLTGIFDAWMGGKRSPLTSTSFLSNRPPLRASGGIQDLEVHTHASAPRKTRRWRSWRRDRHVCDEHGRSHGIHGAGD